MTKFENAIPILNVTDLQCSLDFYEGTLGFRCGWRQGRMAGIGRDAAHIMLCEGAQGAPGTWVWIGAGDIDTILAGATAKGAKVQMPPTNFPWAYEMRIEDPDGHVLRFGSDPRSDLPFAG